MEQVKLPQIKVKLNQLWDSPSNDEKQWAQVNPSCLLAYLGIRGYANPKASGDKTASKNALPILTYFDIFKNYYANTQEEKEYMIVIGKHLATTEKFPTREAAEERINATDWNLVGAMIYACK